MVDVTVTQLNIYCDQQANPSRSDAGVVQRMPLERRNYEAIGANKYY
jgi:hypothetical protein